MSYVCGGLCKMPVSAAHNDCGSAAPRRSSGGVTVRAELPALTAYLQSAPVNCVPDQMASVCGSWLGGLYKVARVYSLNPVGEDSPGVLGNSF